MGFGNWLLTGNWEVREEAPTPDPLTIPARDSSPTSVDAKESLTLPTVFRAVQLISTSTTQLSIDLYKGDEKLDIVPGFIRKPNVNDSFESFIEETTNSLALDGNAYWRISRDNQGRIQNLEVLNPLDVLPNVTPSGKVTSYKYLQQEKPIPAADIKHLKFFRIPGSARGLGPIQAAQKDLRGAIDVRDYAANWFNISGVPSGLLKTEQTLSDEVARSTQNNWDTTPAGRTRILGNGLDYKAVYLSPRDAQFLENRNYSVTEVARVFGIPAALLLAAVQGNSQTYSNISQAWVEFSKFTISGYTREIEVAFSDLLPRGTVARFNFEAFLRPDVVTRYDMHTKAISAGWMTPNEVRKIEGYPALPGGDVLKPSQPKEATDAEQV